MKKQLMRRSSVVALLTLVVCASALANDEFVPNVEPHLEIHRAPGTIRIDGQLDDPGWSGAAVASGFSESEPGDRIKPAVDTDVLVTYDDGNLYVAFLCYDDPSQVRATLCERDRMLENDAVEVFVDTYGDGVWAYDLMTNAYGVQCDWMYLPASYDQGFDILWESKGRITEQGWQVEIRIPFSSLRFPDTEEQTWRIDFGRVYPRNTYALHGWSAVDRNNPCYPCQIGTLTGIRNVKSGRGIDLVPSVFAGQSGQLGTSGASDRADFDNDPAKAELSLSGKYCPSTNVTIEATANPDFSQVEADVAQVDVNTTFALFYPERRPFFQEGIDLFNTWLSVVYTRTINDPTLAAKATGRFGNLSLAYLFGRDEHSPVILPQDEGSAYLVGDQSVSNLARLRYTLGSDSHAGLIATDRRFDDGGYTSVLAGDAQVKLTPNLRWQNQIIGSFTREPDDRSLDDDVAAYVAANIIDSTFDGDKYTARFDGEEYDGYSVITNLEGRFRRVNFDATYWEFSPTLRVDNGFVNRTNKREVMLDADYVHYHEGTLLDRVTLGTFGLVRWDFDGNRQEEAFAVNTTIKLTKAQTIIEASYKVVREVFHDVAFDDIQFFDILTRCVLGKRYTIRTQWSFARDYSRQMLVPDREFGFKIIGHLRPLDQLTVEPRLTYLRSTDAETGEEFFEGVIARLRLNVQPNLRLSTRVVVQYDEFYDRLEVDPLITYQLNSLTQFYLGSTYDYERAMFTAGGDRETRLMSRQYFAKLQYLFQL